MDIGFIQQPQTFISGALGKIDLDSPFCTILGINNLARCVTTLKKVKYEESLTEFMKAAAKWTAIGTVCFGMQKLALSMRPVYVDDVHERAHNELYARGQEGQEISEDAKTFLNRHFANHFSFKSWPQSGKDFIENCLQNNSPAAKANTRYFMERSTAKNDYALPKTIIKTCAAAKWSTDSCMTAQEAILKNPEANINKMTRLCGENQNDFCQKARNIKVQIALDNNDWNHIIKDCVRSDLSIPTCSVALTSIEKKLEVPSEEMWNTAKRVNSACRDNNLVVCQKAKNIVITRTMDYGNWEEILRFLNKECKTPKAECTPLIEKASAKFFSEIPNELPVEDLWDLYYELKYPFNHRGPPSAVPLAMKLATACVSQEAKKHAEKLISKLEACKDTLATHKDSYYSQWKQDEIKAIINRKLVDLKENLNKLPV